MGHRTGLGDILRAYQYLNRSADYEADTQLELARRSAFYDQILAQNQSAQGLLNEEMTPNQRFEALGMSPNLSQHVLPSLVKQTIGNQGNLATTRLKNELNPQSPWKNVIENSIGGRSGLRNIGSPTAPNWVHDSIPNAPGFIPIPPKPTGTNININTERKALDNKMGGLGAQYYDDLRSKAHLAQRAYSRVRDIDNLLDGETTGSFAPTWLAAQKGIKAVLPNAIIPDWDESIGKRETAEILGIKNALDELQHYKGPTTDFEFMKAFQANPSLLTTASGRNTAMVLLERDSKRAQDAFGQARKARLEGTYDATFEPTPYSEPVEEPSSKQQRDERIVLDDGRVIMRRPDGTGYDAE